MKGPWDVFLILGLTSRICETAKYKLVKGEGWVCFR